jgi:hypothetical protein
MPFLSDKRRADLIEVLIDMGLPADLAVECASAGEDLRLLDEMLRQLLDRVSEHYKQLREPCGIEERSILETRLSTDLLTYVAYDTEAKERQLLARMLPKATRAAETLRAAIRVHTTTAKPH